jgi:hypothetical protein
MSAMKLFTLTALLLVSSLSLFGQDANDPRLGSDRAAPKIAAFMDKLNIAPNTMYTLTDADMAELITLASDIHINVFEIIDCMFRYVSPKSIRIVMTGSSLRKMQTKFDLGGDRVLAILSIEKIRYLEFGARLKQEEKDLDLYLDSPSERYIEIGTAIYETRYGFNTLKPRYFGDAYGIVVKKIFITTPLEKLELFAPGKGAIYVKGLSKPKKWNLDVITPLH